MAASVCCGVAYADAGRDAVEKFDELSRQAEQLAETINATSVDLDKKLQQLREADQKHADDLAALDGVKAELAGRQGYVDTVAAVFYTGGRTDGFHALLTAESPQRLIDTLDVQRTVATGMTEQLQSFRKIHQDAQTIEAASAQSAVQAKEAVDAAVAMRADLQQKQSQLAGQIAEAKARLGMLPPGEQAALAGLPPSVMEALAQASPVPTVGMVGLVPNAKRLVAYIMAAYPGVQSIGGVRADPLPDHPSGHAIDIMIGSDMGLGDAINADLQRQFGNFGISYTMWRVPDHFNHVHVTVF